MNVLLIIFNWLFSNPTAIIALISAIIALLAYSHQRKGMRKQNACNIAEKYAREILPRMRYIDRLLTVAKLKTIAHKFTGFEFFTEKELNELLLKAESDEQHFRDGFKELSKEDLQAAFAACGGNDFIRKSHVSFLQILEDSKELIGEAVCVFIKDFLNDMEAISTILRYNVADEKLIYQSLHQTFLKTMNLWYFYISDENRKDQDRFYANTIWLYNTWNNRKKHDEATIDRVLAFTTKAKRL